MAAVVKSLKELARRLDENIKDSNTRHRYTDIMDDILFQAKYRFIDYQPFQADDDPFEVRLLSWMANVSNLSDASVLLEIVHRLVYIDEKQMRSLYIDAYRRIIVPWLLSEPTAGELLDANYSANMLSLLNDYHLASFTESFDGSFFKNINALQRVRKVITLGEKEEVAVRQIRSLETKNIRGIVILEDFVGSGKQVRTILNYIKDELPEDWRILVVPLIILSTGYDNIKKYHKMTFDLEPVLVLNAKEVCIKKIKCKNGDAIKDRIRGLIKKTAKKVKEPLDNLDREMNNPFGFDGTGSLVITTHNAPNNSIMMLHHKAPSWNHLFRRLEHDRG